MNPEIEHLLKAYGQETPEALSRVTVKELWENCLSPTMSQTIENLLPLLLLCFVFKLICSFSKSGELGGFRNNYWGQHFERIEPHHEKTCLRGLRPDKIQTGLFSYGD